MLSGVVDCTVPVEVGSSSGMTRPAVALWATVNELLGLLFAVDWTAGTDL